MRGKKPAKKTRRTFCRIDLDGGSLDTQAEIDDMVISGDLIDFVHIERMDSGDVWGAVYFRDNSPRLYLWWGSKRKIEFTGHWDGRREKWPCEPAPPPPPETKP